MSVIRHLLKRSWAASLILSRVGIGLLLQKIVAVKYGPLGTTYLSHFQNFISLFTQPLQDIIGQGMINGIRQKKIQEKELTSSVFIFSLFLVVSLFSVLLVFQQITITNLNFVYNYWYIILLSLIFFALQLMLMNYLVAKGDLKALFFLTIIPGTIILIVVHFLHVSLYILLMSYLGMQAATSVLYLAYTIKSYPQLYAFTFRIPVAVRRHFLNFLAIGLTIWLSSKLTSFYIRDYAMGQFPTTDTGHWQAIARISDAYKGLFLSYLMISLFPALSENLNARSLAQYFRKFMLPYSLMVIGFLTVLLLFKEQLLIMLYDHNYSAASWLFNWQILGDFFALFSFPFALILLAKVATKKYIMADMIGTIIYLFAIYLIPLASIEVFFYAYLIRYLVYLSLTVTFTKKYWSIA